MVTRLRATSSVLFAAVIMLIASMAPLEPANAQPPEWPNLAFSPIAAELNQPVHITHAGDGSGRIFVVERAGRIRILSGGSLLPAPFLDISSIVRDDGSEEGLLSLAFGPNFDESGQFYVYFTDDRPDNRGNNVMARFSVSNDPNIADPLSEELILGFDHPTYENHNGGQIAFGPDGYLYIGTGDGGGSGDPFDNAQDPLSLLGKLLRIQVEPTGPDSPPTPVGPYRVYLPLIAQNPTLPYTIPQDNPFVGMTGYREEIWTLGLRNPWRFSFDRASGDLFIADVGQSAREELDVQPASSPGGENYGWPCKEGTLDFDFTPECASLTMVVPLFEYDHSLGCSVTGGYMYRGPNNPRMQGVYFLGDYCTGRIWGVQQIASVWNFIELTDTSYNISTFGEDEAGNLYLADYTSGTIFQVTDAP